ncbi:MAG: hypothetical protein O3A46_09440 [Candidatus Poribacteria bacterium]|nr:hypothetical protein [Candidatus Poribacteria bacterium]
MNARSIIGGIGFLVALTAMAWFARAVSDLGETPFKRYSRLDEIASTERFTDVLITFALRRSDRFPSMEQDLTDLLLTAIEDADEIGIEKMEALQARLESAQQSLGDAPDGRAWDRLAMKFALARQLFDGRDQTDIVMRFRAMDALPEIRDWSNEVDDINADVQVIRLYLIGVTWLRLENHESAARYFPQIVQHAEAGRVRYGDGFEEIAGDAYGAMLTDAETFISH